MKDEVSLFKVLAEPNRLRILSLLRGRERFVCQLMAVLGLSQPLVSRDLALLERAGLLASRRLGKQVYYRWAEPLPPLARRVLAALAEEWETSATARADLAASDELQRRFGGGEGVCDMAAVRRYLAYRHDRTMKIQSQEEG
ncbi:MAG TPA: metalloregulator ArsR/SmtB family transcription factor [Candidatus Aminicenantes bacterium]|nr:metalloregulator ArsR/SmtB family transcription factor [Candidatus Aminicenantes bacterium]